MNKRAQPRFAVSVDGGLCRSICWCIFVVYRHVTQVVLETATGLELRRRGVVNNKGQYG